jgi:hypothetical protein
MLRETGLSRVSHHNNTFLETMRSVARMLLRKGGFAISTDDLRKYAECHNIHPDHPNAWGAVFRDKSFVPCGFRQSTRENRHAGLIRVWTLRKHT